MKTIVITGATSGIGFETARILTRRGNFVIGVGHSEEGCNQAREKIARENPNAKFIFFVADLMQQREVNRVADDITTYLSQNFAGALDVLINNAGCVKSWYMTTEEGYEQQFALNYLAGFLLTYRLLGMIQKANGRIIMTGSDSHKGIKVHWRDVMLSRAYNPLTAYKQSKLCTVLFAKALSERFSNKGVHAYVVDPGLVKTDIGNKQTGSLVNFVWTLRKRHGVPPEIPAKTYDFLSGETAAPKGLYYNLCREKKVSRQVNSENADRLFALSETLCGVRYDVSEAMT